MPVTVLEQSAAFSDIGAGIQLSPNATRVLQNFGLSEPLAASASRPAALEMRNWRSGALIFSRELGDSANRQFGAPYLNIHRADLHALLLEASRRSGSIDIQLNARGIDVHRGDGCVHASTGDGRDFTADVLIGADGIKSLVRTALFGAGKPRFTGCVAWRGLVPAEALRGRRPNPVAALWMGPRAHFVHYYVRGGEQINFVAVIEQRGWEVESWSQRGDKNDLIADFSGWHEPIGSIIASADPEGCYKWALFDRKPMPRWSTGNITLLGDACHPTLPFMAQGACMAIEDAAVFAECLAAGSEIEPALERYERLRRPRTANIQQISRMNQTLYHLPATMAWVRDLGAPIVTSHFSRRLDRLFGYDALAAAD